MEESHQQNPQPGLLPQSRKNIFCSMHNLGPSNSWWKKTSVQLHWLFWSYLRKGAFVKYLLFELAEAVTRCKVLRSSWAHMCLTREGPEVSISGWEKKFSSQRGFFLLRKVPDFSLAFAGLPSALTLKTSLPHSAPLPFCLHSTWKLFF